MSPSRFSYPVLLAFVALEVLFYDGNRAAQSVITVAEYLFVTIALLKNRETGIAYLVSFTLLAMAGWSYITSPTLPANFWGMRLFGFSLNVLYSLGVLALLLAGDMRYRFTRSPGSRFFAFFVVYSTLVGLISVALSVNYLDNFITDVLTYLPFAASLYFVSVLSAETALTVVKFCISATVVSMILSFLTGHLFEYGSGFYFILMNSFAFVVVFSLFFMKDWYGRRHFAFLVASLVALLLTGSVFLGGKTIVILAMTGLWFALRSKQNFAVGSLILTALLLSAEPLLAWTMAKLGESALAAYKFTQIADVFSLLDIHMAAAAPNTMGNLVAEAMTTSRHLWDHKLMLVFGKGFGGGVPDVYGYLAPLAGPGYGYSERDVVRDDYFRMHLPIYEVLLKAGLVGCVGYAIVLYKSLRQNHIVAFTYFVLLLTVFFVSKEMMLLTLLFMRITGETGRLPGAWEQRATVSGPQ